jgi:2-phosphosulfolactate phosphatase
VSQKTPGIEVVVSPLLYPARQIIENFDVVIVDIFRAGTTICTALSRGVEKIIPVASVEEALRFKEMGFLIAGERDGIKLEFADFGNSPAEMMNADLKDKTLVLTTTNGTRAIETASGANRIAIGTFTNLVYLSEWLFTLKRNIVILCSGWKETFSLEDTVFAGALIESLIPQSNRFILYDSSVAAFELWKSAKADLASYLKNGSHYQRLVQLGLQKDLDLSVRLDSTRVIPVYEKNYLKNILK